MKRTIALVLGCVALLSSAAMAKDFTYMAGADATAMTQYTFRGMGLSKHFMAADVHAGVSYKGWLTGRASAWYGQSMLAHNPWGSQEQIYDLSLTAAPSKWYVAVTGGWTYYDGQIGGDNRELYAVITAAPRAHLPFNAGLAVIWGYNQPYYAFIPHASKTWALPDISDKLSLTLYGEYAHVFSPGFDSLSDAKASVAFDYQLTQRVVITPKFELVAPGNWVPETRALIPGASINVAYNTNF
ncbi:MAG: hypothetical protein HZB16_07400 [Armatimonadetes bacterium]|nr:hypothetical protein [Armatimonadota bacterium]